MFVEQFYPIKSFFILAVLRRRVQRVCGAHLRNHSALATQLSSKKDRSGDEPLATLRPI